MSEAVVPEWFQEVLTAHDVEVFDVGRVFNETAWACNGDCCCFFILSDTHYIDRYSYVTDQGWCQGQDCPCHSVPRERPGHEL